MIGKLKDVYVASEVSRFHSQRTPGVHLDPLINENIFIVLATDSWSKSAAK